MSIRLMTLAWDLKLQPTIKLVLLAMCDWSNDAGFCYPSIPTVARKTCISTRHCQRIMSELIDTGLIAVVGNLHGGMGSRRYQINLCALRDGAFKSTGDKLSPVVPTSAPPVTSASGAGAMDVMGTSSNRQSDPPLPDVPRSIDWAHLSQLSDADRVVVVDMLNGLEASQRQDIVDELAGALRAKVIKTQWPGWLRGVVQRARTGAFVPNHALVIQRDRQRILREAAEVEKRRAEEARRRDPETRARGLAAMKAAIAEMGLPSKRGGIV